MWRAWERKGVTSLNILLKSPTSRQTRITTQFANASGLFPSPTVSLQFSRHLTRKPMDRAKPHAKHLYNSSDSCLYGFNPIQGTSSVSSLTKHGGNLSTTWEPPKCSIWPMLRQLAISLLWGAPVQGCAHSQRLQWGGHTHTWGCLPLPTLSWESLGYVLFCGVVYLLPPLVLVIQLKWPGLCHLTNPQYLVLQY